MRKGIWIFLLLFLGSCATHAKFLINLNSFVGQSQPEVLSFYGPPTKTLKLSDGTLVWSYSHSSTSYLGSSSGNTYQPLGGNDYFNQTSSSSSVFLIPLHRNCSFWFIFGKNNRVKSVGNKGNHCVSKKVVKQQGTER